MCLCEGFLVCWWEDAGLGVVSVVVGVWGCWSERLLV